MTEWKDLFVYNVLLFVSFWGQEIMQILNHLYQDNQMSRLPASQNGKKKTNIKLFKQTESHYLDAYCTYVVFA